MERSEGDERLDADFHGVVDQDRRAELAAAMHDAMARGVDVIEFRNEREGRIVGGGGAGRANAFDHARVEYGVVPRVDAFVLERTAARVQAEDDQEGASACAWSAVMSATV